MRKLFRYSHPVIICCLALLSRTYGQHSNEARPVSGVVKARNGTPVAGVSVSIKHSTRGTVTDDKGKFVITAHPGDTLVLSAVGFMKIERPCGKTALLSLILPEDHRELDNVMVIGYGRERKTNITGSIVSISGEELAKVPALSFDNALAGKAAGVNIISSSGVPGSATAITIRGLSTLAPDGSHPLVVIDGVPVFGSGKNLNTSSFQNSTTPAIGFGGTSVADNITPAQEFENNPLSALNPADIESIEILKDAYATSIYGSRGAAGVILVTTKKGAKGKPLFNVRYTAGAIQPIAKPKLLNGPQYNEVYTNYYKQLGQNSAVFSSPYNTDWVDAVTRTAFSQQADVALAAGTDKSRYYISGSYTSQPSYIINNDYKRYTGRVNLTYQPSAAISTGINMTMTHSENSAMNAPAIYRAAVLKAPNLPIMDNNGNYVYGKGTNPYGNMDSNPVADAVLNTNELHSTEALGNVFAEYKPVSWLALRSEFGAQVTSGEAYTRRVKRPSGYGDDAVQSTSQNRKIVINNTIHYLQTLGGKHYINAMAGQSYEQSTETMVRIGGYGFFSDDIRSIQAANNRYIAATLKQKWALVSYFTRFNYEWNRKYLAGITYRVDGSSRFSRNRRYVGFPSFSAGWRLTEESFMRKLSWANDIKLRGSIGFTGNNSSTSYYGSQGQYRLNSNNLSYAGTPILQMLQPDNPNLKWERTRSIDIGLDAVLLDKRLTITADYYQRRIRNMILTSAVPRYQGWVVQSQNIGDMLNKGVELMVTAEIIRKADWGWTASLNASTNSNKILKLTFNGQEVGLANDAYKLLREGEPAGQFFLYNWVGIDPMTGNPMWNDGKGGISYTPPAARFAEVDDVNVFRSSYGTSLPDYFGGFGNTITYKGWELYAFFSWSVGNKMINGSYATLLTYTTEDANNLSSRILDYWLVPGHETDIPRLVNKSVTTAPGSASSGVRDYTVSRTNSRFLEDASYLRLRTITLTYTAQPQLLQRTVLKNVRLLQLFVRGTNLWTLTKYTGLDPEVSAFGSSAIQSGYDELTMPQNKMIQFGINLGL